MTALRFILSTGLLVAVTAISYAYRCPGWFCDLDDVAATDCATYVEVPQVDPIVPASVPKKLILAGANCDHDCPNADHTVTTTISATKTDSESGSATGAVASTVATELSGGVKDKIGVKASVSVTNTSTTTSTFTGSITYTIANSNTMPVSAYHKGYLNGFITHRTGSFTQHARLRAGWNDSCGCHDVPCGATSGTGSGEAFGLVVHWRQRVLPCPTCDQLPGGPS